MNVCGAEGSDDGTLGSLGAVDTSGVHPQIALLVNPSSSFSIQLPVLIYLHLHPPVGNQKKRHFNGEKSHCCVFETHLALLEWMTSMKKNNFLISRSMTGAITASAPAVCVFPIPTALQT